MGKGKTGIYAALSDIDKLKWNVARKGLVTGIAAGLTVVLYRLGIEYATQLAGRIYAFLRAQPLLILPWIVLVAGAGFLIARLIRFEPMATGSGIPQVEGLLLYGMKIKWACVLFVRFAAGILSALFGLSLGREGPSIQIGAACSQAVAEKMSKNKLEENYLITGGAAAGLSAAFNAPLSGIVFTLEEVHRSFSPLVLIAATTASLTADVVSKYFFGLKPVLSFAHIPQLPVALYVWLLPIGLVSGLVGALMNKALLGFQTLFTRLPQPLRPIVALLLALPCGLFLPQVLGGGQNLIKLAENAKSGLSMLLLILVVKLLFTCTSFGSGVPGGIFMPILSVGALSGSLMGIAASHLSLPPKYIPVFAVCAMAGVLSGSVKAPVTSILLAAEMTGSLVHLLPVAACCFLALLLSDLVRVTPIYEALLERMEQNAGASARSTKNGGVLEIPVELGSPAAGKKISEVSWPQGALIVGIRRGQKDMVPSGGTEIFPGDYLLALSCEQTYADLGSELRLLCHTGRKQA